MTRKGRVWVVQMLVTTLVLTALTDVAAYLSDLSHYQSASAVTHITAIFLVWILFVIWACLEKQEELRKKNS